VPWQRNGISATTFIGIDNMLPFNDLARLVVAKTPPGMEEWVKKRKAEFKEKYGKKWKEVLYATAWKRFNTKAASQEPDIICMSTPLFIRALEFAREDAKDDEALHTFTERALALHAKGAETISMDEYASLTKVLNKGK
jgi:hypothetical protein